MGWNWPWARPKVERKGDGVYGFVALHAQGDAAWTRRDYATLAREGFMRNPTVHRCVRLIAEAAASVPWLLYEQQSEVSEHPLLELLARPNPRCSGASFMEVLYGHLLMSGNAYVELVEAGETRELHLLRPDHVSVVTDASGWPVALEQRQGEKK